MQYYESDKSANKFNAKLFYKNIVCENEDTIKKEWEDLMNIAFVKNNFMDVLFDDYFIGSDEFDESDDKNIEIFAELHQYGIQIKTAYNIIDMLRECFIDFDRIGVKLIWKHIAQLLYTEDTAHNNKVKINDIISIKKHGLVGKVISIKKATLTYKPIRFIDNHNYVTQYEDVKQHNEYDVHMRDIIILDPVKYNNNIFVPKN